jgi:hypothetical protein
VAPRGSHRLALLSPSAPAPSFSSWQQCPDMLVGAVSNCRTIVGRITQLHRPCSRLRLRLHPTILAVPSVAPIVKVRGPIWPAFLHRHLPELCSARVSCSTPFPSPFSHTPASPSDAGALAPVRPLCRALERRGRRVAAPPYAMSTGVLAPVSHPAKPWHQSVWLGAPSTPVSLAPPMGSPPARAGPAEPLPASVSLTSGVGRPTVSH